MFSFVATNMSKACIAVSIYAVTVTVFSIALIVLGIKGKEESNSSTVSGPDYYVGPIVVGSVFALVGITTIYFIVVAYRYGDGESAKWCSCCISYGFGFGACITGLVFVIRFGIHNCDDVNDRSDNCSYNMNINTNYTIAVISLVLILLLFISLCCSCSIFTVDEEKFKKPKWNSAPQTFVPVLERERQQNNNQNNQPFPSPGGASIRAEVEDLRGKVERLERRNKRLANKVNGRDALSHPQEREIGSMDTSNERLPVLNQLKSQMRQLQNQLRMMQSNAPRNAPDAQQPSSSRASPSSPPRYDDQPPSYHAAVYGQND